MSLRSATGNTLSSPRSGLPSYNAIDHGTTVRPSSTSLLCVDSEDRYNDYVAATNAPSSPYNFKINQPKTLMNGFFTRIAVSEVVFPWTIPNINAKTRTIDIVTQIGAAAPVFTTLNVPLGFYTPAALAQYIQDRMNFLIVGLGMSMQYGQTTGPFFNYFVGAGNTISFFPMTYNSAAYPYPASTKQLIDVLGFGAANAVAAVSGVGNYTLCQATRYVDIVCPQLTYNQPLKDTMTQITARDTLCRIYVGGAPGVSSTTMTDSSGALFCPPGCAPTVIYRDFSNPKQIAWLPNQGIPGYLTFQVYDDAGALLDEALATANFLATPSSDWSMTMLVTEC